MRAQEVIGMSIYTQSVEKMRQSFHQKSNIGNILSRKHNKNKTKLAVTYREQKQHTQNDEVCVDLD